MTNTNSKEFTLIGAGIMSATLGVFLKQLMPEARISIYERLDKVGAESSDAWNNAGTGHSSFCELNYTPLKEDGKVDISKALRIASAFEVSKQFWAYLKSNGHLARRAKSTQSGRHAWQGILNASQDLPGVPNPNDGSPDISFFINDIPHMSFVWGEKNVDFLKKRYEALTQYAMFQEMEYSEDFAEIAEWVPLMMKGRVPGEKIAATKMEIGTDVNFGAITRGMIKYLESCEGVELHLGHEIQDLTHLANGRWLIEMEDLDTKEHKVNYSDFVFIGAGGGALPLLDKADIPEGRGYGGFPVSGQWLRCTNPEVIAQHEAKVYGKAATGSPPMSVPHLDTRFMNGKKALLFGPYAGFSTKFLKHGSYLDLPLSIEMHNIWPMISAGLKNYDLTKYLVQQVVQSPEDRFEALQQYYPEARFEDWELAIAGQRVQIIKGDKEEGGGALKFGTEIICNADGSLSALLGASPGASTSVNIMLGVLDKCFPKEMASQQWKAKLCEMIPSYGKSLIEDGELCLRIRDASSEMLKLDD